MRRIYWDSCVAIYRVEHVEPWSSRLAAREAELGDEFVLCVSDLTWMECRVGPVASGHAELLARYDEFFARAELVRVPLDREVFRLATQLRATHRLKTPDALHLAAALSAGCDELWTNDHRLDTAAAAALSVIVPGDVA